MEVKKWDKIEEQGEKKCVEGKKEVNKVVNSGFEFHCSIIFIVFFVFCFIKNTRMQKQTYFPLYFFLTPIRSCSQFRSPPLTPLLSISIYLSIYTSSLKYTWYFFS